MSRRNDVDDTGWNGPHGRRGGQQPAMRRPRLSLRRQIAAWTSVALVSVLVAGSLVAYAKYRSYWDSIKRIDVQGIIGRQPPKLNNAENILLIGSDTRTGQGGVGGYTPGCNCSDTLMLLHISPGHHRATVVSIPRDTMVPVMSCAPSDGTSGQQAAPGQYERINSALEAGGPACTWKVFEAVTGIHVDHFVQLEFTGFEKVIDDLGGVTICLPFPVHNPLSGLNLNKGRHHVFGREALAFWRTREDTGLGSDLQRIQRDQYLMAALVQGIEHSGLLHSPTKVLSVIRDATGAMTTDTGLDQNTMLAIADSLQGVTSKSVQFVTAPNIPWPADPGAEVEFAQPQAGQLFSMIAHDTTVPRAGKGQKTGGKPATSPQLDAAPSQVNVNVENGSGVTGIAAQAGSDLTHLGFNVVGTGDASNFGYTNSVIEYAGSSDLRAVNTLKAQLSNVTVEQDAALTPGTLDLIIGSTFSGFSPQSSSSASPSSSPSSSHPASSISAAEGATINGSANICSDQAAFSGPDS